MMTSVAVRSSLQASHSIQPETAMQMTRLQSVIAMSKLTTMATLASDLTREAAGLLDEGVIFCQSVFKLISKKYVPGEAQEAQGQASSAASAGGAAAL